MRNPGHSRSQLLARSLMLAPPAVLTIFWPIYSVNRDVAIPLLRPIMLGSAILLGLVWSGKPVTRPERRLTAMLGILVLALLVPTILATQPVRAGTEWVKLILMCVYCVAMARALRDRAGARIFAIGLVVAACAMGILLLGTYVNHMGFRIPSYDALRRYKGVAVNAGVMVNPVAFSCLFSFVCALCVLRVNKLLCFIGLGLLLICTFVTGTRMPPVVTVVAGFLLFVIAGVRSRKLPIYVFTWIGILCAAGALGIVLWTSRSEDIFRTMSKASEGRWDVWSVALTKFTERPIFGYGYLSWRDDLVSRLPGEYKMTRQIAEMVAGGYHNEFMTALAEQGIFGFAAVASMFLFMLRSGWRLAFGNWSTWKHGQWALFAGIFLVLRATVEVPGLFGYAQEPADFIAFAFVALLVATESGEEDYLRATAYLERIEVRPVRFKPAPLPPPSGLAWETSPRLSVAEGAD